jgi:hypothetical protein
LRATTQLLRSDTATVRDRMPEEGQIFCKQLASPEFAEAVMAFMKNAHSQFQLEIGCKILAFSTSIERNLPVGWQATMSAYADFSAIDLWKLTINV